MQSAPSPQDGHAFSKAEVNKERGRQSQPAQIRIEDASAIEKNNPLSAAGKKLSGSVEGIASKAFGGISSLAVRLTNKNKHR
ncbi:hypothetical protein LRR81_02265 [Metabacillus sp. GX 13764]|uniref:hypothetical protein n=1 Tax=Metabacillus kandeliae TaxID=2900151 RepID=UPI001E31D8F2|nr:hypothetical protein [Metabacillus kandeliae]MCD7033037.1 hypothetical protein [Metabacillus kandeliae]